MKEPKEKTALRAALKQAEERAKEAFKPAEVAYMVYAVKNLPNGEKDRRFLGGTYIKTFAICGVRDAIASGFDYGYIKQGTDTVGYYKESSFLRSV